MKKVIPLFLFLAVFVSLTNNVGAQNRWSRGIRGEGELVKKTFDVKDYTKFGLGVGGAVYIKKGNSNSITIEAQQNVLDNIEVEQEGKSLNLEFEKNVRDYKPITIYLEMDNIEGLSIGGNGDIVVEDRFDNLGNVELAIGGSGSIAMAGKASKVEVSLAGSGDVKCENLMAKKVEVSIAGSGDVFIGADDELEVSIAGSGDVRYKGQARVSSSIVGSGSVSSM